VSCKSPKLIPKVAQFSIPIIIKKLIDSNKNGLTANMPAEIIEFEEFGMKPSQILIT
jgi:hypothetical protein